LIKKKEEEEEEAYIQRKHFVSSFDINNLLPLDL
jgi:hypothetical protein